MIAKLNNITIRNGIAKIVLEDRLNNDVFYIKEYPIYDYLGNVDTSSIQIFITNLNYLLHNIFIKPNSYLVEKQIISDKFQTVKGEYLTRDEKQKEDENVIMNNITNFIEVNSELKHIYIVLGYKVCSILDVRTELMKHLEKFGDIDFVGAKSLLAKLGYPIFSEISNKKLHLILDTLKDTNRVVV